jgi:N4-gp56 family major capsid protein
MLSIEVPGLIHGMLAMDKKMSANSGYIYRVSRTNRLENAMVPLEDSPVVPPAINMSRVDIDVKPKFYGKHMILTEQATLLNVDPVMNEAVKVLGIQMRTTMDALTRDALAATASVYNCTGGVNGIA